MRRKCPETQNAKKELLFYVNKCIGCGACVAVCPNNIHKLAVNKGDIHLPAQFHTINRSNCVACGKCATACPTTAVELCGKDYEINELVDVVEKDRAFYGQDGGVTISGGEPLMQGDGVVALLKKCKQRSLHTVVETCGHFDHAILPEVVRYTDLFLWDIKDTDAERHKKFTGVSNEKILSNLISTDRLGAKIRLRGIVVNGVNTDEAHYRQVAKIARSLTNCEDVEFFPYHAYGGSKATFLGYSDNGRKNGFLMMSKLRNRKSSSGKHEVCSQYSYSKEALSVSKENNVQSLF